MTTTVIETQTVATTEQLASLAEFHGLDTFNALAKETTQGAPVTSQSLEVYQGSAKKPLSQDEVKRKLNKLVEIGLAVSAPKGHAGDDRSRDWYWVNTPENAHSSQLAREKYESRGGSKRRASITVSEENVDVLYDAIVRRLQSDGHI